MHLGLALSLSSGTARQVSGSFILSFHPITKFFDVANAKAAYRAANVFAPPTPMAQLFINCIREVAKPKAKKNLETPCRFLARLGPTVPSCLLSRRCWG